MGTTSIVGPFYLQNSFAWSWKHQDSIVLTGGTLFDDNKNIYTAAMDGIRKFSPEGVMIWVYRTPALISSCPSLMDDAIYGSTLLGHMFALSLETGEEIWIGKHADMAEMDNSYV